MLRHGATYAGHPACCAAALAVLDIYEREGLIERAAATSKDRSATRSRRSPAHPRSARSARGSASSPRSSCPRTRWPPSRARWRARARPPVRLGVLVRPLLKGVAVSPPLICEQEHIDLLRQGIEAGLERIGSAPAKPDQSSGG